MFALIKYLQSGLQALRSPQHAVDNQGDSIPGLTHEDKPSSPRFAGVSEARLQQIIAQVHRNGFHVESLSIFQHGNAQSDDALQAIHQWAAISGLKMSFNSNHEICFFEKQ